MVKIRKSAERGSANHGWLDTKHTFSFSNYYDPDYMGFRSLRVINEDFIAPDSGFGMHPHKNMEIISYVVSGALTHRDNMGNESVLKAGEFQAMSAGKGVVHSEFNSSISEKVHLLQIWILPEVQGLNPSYQELQPKLDKGLRLVASQDGGSDSLKINQNLNLYFGNFERESRFDYPLVGDRGIWLQLVSGELEFTSGTLKHQMQAGDGVSIEGERPEFRVVEDSKFLLFDLK